MRIVLQRVRSGRVHAEGRIVGAIDHGLVLLVGIAPCDSETVFRWMIEKIIRLRLFDGSTGFMERSLTEVEGGVLLVSQFTLFGDVNKGTRPSFSAAAPSEDARALFAQFAELFRQRLPGRVETGIFGADMIVDIVNDGPVTLIIDK